MERKTYAYKELPKNALKRAFVEVKIDEFYDENLEYKKEYEHLKNANFLELISLVQDFATANNYVFYAIGTIAYEFMEVQ